LCRTFSHQYLLDAAHDLPGDLSVGRFDDLQGRNDISVVVGLDA
jgi:hypothetical protein